MKKIIVFLIPILMFSCIGQDIIQDEVSERIVVPNPISDLAIGDTYQFTATFFNNVGQIEEASFIWSSSDPSIISITEDGLAEGLTEGMVTISVSTQESATALYTFTVGAGTETIVMENPTSRSGTIQTTSSYLLEGDFTLASTSNGLDLQLASNFKATTALPGLYVYLSNNPNSISGAHEIGEVTVFSGLNKMSIDNSVGIMDFSYLLYYCKPFNVKVGEGEIK